jgi:uncharacterized phage infection (PIP) family protein YhgE
MTNLDEKEQSDPIQDLTNIVYLMNGLHTKLSQESHLMATSTGQIGQTANQLEESLNVLKKETATIQKTIQNELKHMGQKITQDVSVHIMESSSAELEKTLFKLQMVTHSIENNLSFWKRNITFLVLMGTLVGGLIGGGLVHFLYPPIDKHLSPKLEAGSLLLKAWPKLNAKERERIKSLGR